MRRVLAVLALASIPVLTPSTAAALGFGRTGNASLIGQPLDFSAVLMLDPGETITADCVGAEVLAGDKRLAPSQVRLRLEGPPRGSRVTVHVGTTVRIVEPVVTIRLSVGCGSARLSRSFVAFIEPPRGRREVPVNAAATAPVRDGGLAASPPNGITPAQAPAAADANLLQREREHLRALEEDLGRARTDNASAQQNLAALQARLREAEAARRTPPLVYGLGTLVVLLLIALGAVLWRLMRPRIATKASGAGAEDLRPADLALALKESPLDHTWTQMRVVTEPPPSGPTPLESTQPPPTTTAPAARPTTPELSVEDVLDLEQQADFLVALGQDEAAIDLLMVHLRSSGGASAMPYLKLLEIYRRRADGDAHERIRQRFNRRFNAHAPAIAANPQAGQPLAGHADVMARLQAAWASPEVATALLESLMVRSDTSDPGFDLPAFAELMLLHAIARDLREREVGEGGVDLLLPLAEEKSVISVGAVHAAALDLQLP